MALVSDEELRAKLIEFGVDVGPIDSNTRKIYTKKLDRLIASKTTSNKRTPKRSSRKTRATRRTTENEDENQGKSVSKNTSLSSAQVKPIHSEERVSSSVSKRLYHTSSPTARAAQRPVVMTRIKETFSSDDDGLTVQRTNMQTTTSPYSNPSTLVAQNKKVDQWLSSGKQVLRRNLMSNWVSPAKDNNSSQVMHDSTAQGNQQNVPNNLVLPKSQYWPIDATPFLYLLLIIILLIAFARVTNDSKQYKVLSKDIPQDNLLHDVSREECAAIMTYLMKGIHKQSAKYECTRGVPERWITWHQATELVTEVMSDRTISSKKPKNDTIKGILKLFSDLSSNFPDWCITVSESGVENVTYHFQSCRSANFGCVLWRLVQNSFYLFLVVSIVVIPCYTYYTWSEERKRAHKRWSIELYKLIDRIIEVVRTHYTDSMNSGDALPYVAVSHVRDILIPPIQRQRKRKLWNEAANYVSKNDSRVRLETQRIAGEDFEVWRWTCQSSPALNHKFKSLYSSLPIEKNSEIEQLIVPGIGFKVWQGQIKHTNNIISRTIECNDSCCLKLGNMFDYELESGSDWTSRIQDAILEKCGDSSSIVHIHVERYSNRGSVYIKCSQIEDAKETFKAMHGCIFDGRIVRARFISNQTYHSLFPDAAKFSEPLKPSNDSVRSMIFLAEANIYLS